MTWSACVGVGCYVPAVSRQKPSRPQVELADLELIVRPPGDPLGIKAFTAAELVDAEFYASQVGATVEPLPLASPAGS